MATKVRNGGERSLVEPIVSVVEYWMNDIICSSIESIITRRKIDVAVMIIALY